MKFGRSYAIALKHGGYPNHWVDSAISYRQLKKCIRKLELEFLEIGVSVDDLRKLLQSTTTNIPQEPPVQYTFEGNQPSFEPKLIILIDTMTGAPMNLSLSPGTKTYLQALFDKSQEHSDAIQLPFEQGENSNAKDIPDENVSSAASQPEEVNDISEHVPQMIHDERAYSKVEVPLRYDTEFFRLLARGLSEVHAIQSQEGSELTKDIRKLGQDITVFAGPLQDSTRPDFKVWREILRLYIDSDVFFSTDEYDDFGRPFSVAHTQLEKFATNLRQSQAVRKFRRKENHEMLDGFLRINFALLKDMKFSELNSTATTKILKKFDKRTALNAREKFSDLMAAGSFSPQPLAKALCCRISAEVLAIVPQLNDYTCAVCFSIAYKPIVLSCRHYFCIQCMIVLQRSGENSCPLCRAPVVQEADSTNQDFALANLMKLYFPDEVKNKQKENERERTKDLFQLTD